MYSENIFLKEKKDFIINVSWNLPYLLFVPLSYYINLPYNKLKYSIMNMMNWILLDLFTFSM